MSNPTSKGAALAVTFLFAFGALNPVHAYRDGAPWGASVASAETSCASCHYDYQLVRPSDAIEIDGWPASFIAGKRYLLTLRFSPPAAKIAGFQVTATINGEGFVEDEGERGDAGVFVCATDNVEFADAGIRSTLPRRVEDGLSWTFAWRAPDNAADIAFHVAASAANDDASPFGDVIHYRTFRSSTQR